MMIGMLVELRLVCKMCSLCLKNIVYVYVVDLVPDHWLTGHSFNTCDDVPDHWLTGHSFNTFDDVPDHWLTGHYVNTCDDRRDQV